jgi:DNA-binding transcriptional LysR family regulator
LIANNYPTLLGAAIEGMGLAQVPQPVAAAALTAGKLHRVLDAFAPTAPGVFLYYSNRQHMLPKLRVFIDHVKRQIRTRQRNPR